MISFGAWRTALALVIATAVASLATAPASTGNAEALADAIAGDFSSKTIVYLTGRVRFPAFEARLQAEGMLVRAVETYDTVTLDYSDDAIVERLSGQAVEAALLYSAKAATALQTLVGRPALHHLFEKMQVFTLSGRIAAALDEGAGEKIRIAREPHEEALLELLPRWR